MASRNPRKSYDEETLQALEQALTDVWQVLKAHNPFHDWEEDQELKTLLAEKLMALADAGVKDAELLRSKTLETLSLGRPN